MAMLMESVQQYRVEEVPSSIFYIPNFITEAKENFYFGQVYRAPKLKWNYLSNRRLQNWGGLPHIKGMIPESIPQWLQECCDIVNPIEAFGPNKANHILVNEYKPGQGIMPHSDGPLYYPSVSTISLGGHTLLDFYQRICIEDSPYNLYKFSLLLEPRSLLLLTDEMYSDYLHGICETKKDIFKKKNIKNINLLGNKINFLTSMGGSSEGDIVRRREGGEQYKSESSLDASRTQSDSE